MEDRRERLNELSIEAHKQAIEKKTSTPAEMTEFAHLPMTVVGGIPKLRGDRMRDDQVEDAIEILEYRIGRRSRTTSVSERVHDHMQAYGGGGLRLQDIVPEVDATKPAVLKALRQMAEDGLVYIKEERTRPGGSARKRYFFGLPEYRSWGSDDLPDELQGVLGMNITTGWIPISDEHDSGIIHHGTAVAGVACPCWPCTNAFRDEIVGEQVSLARALGRRDKAQEFGIELCAIRRRELEEAIRG